MARKYAITEKEEEDDNNPSTYSQTQDAKHTLFSGTRIIKVIPGHGTDRVQAFVYSTGTELRGDLSAFWSCLSYPTFLYHQDLQRGRAD